MISSLVNLVQYDIMMEILAWPHGLWRHFTLCIEISFGLFVCKSNKV